ncbi:MAG: ATP-grasp domain-containing protein [Petrotogales bacterium]
MGDAVKDLNVIVTAGGAPGAPGIIKSLRLNGERNINIVSTDMNPESVGLFMADKAYTVPPGTDPEYVSQMLEIAEKEDIDVILPLSTYELMSLSKNKEKFDKIGTKVCVSDPEPLGIANNKGKLYNFLKRNGIPVPESIIIEDFKQLENSAYKLGYPEVPVCIKPQVGKGSRGFRVIRGDVDKFDIYLNYKPDSTITTLYDLLLTLEGAEPFPKLVMTEYLPGKEYSVDLLVRNGKSLVTVPRSRDGIKLGISFIGTVENNPDVARMAEQIVDAIGLDYNINLQLKYSVDGSPKIIEINPRVSGTIILCTGAGVNMPYLGVKMALGEDIPKIGPEFGTKMIRYWEEIFLTSQGDSYHL